MFRELFVIAYATVVLAVIFTPGQKFQIILSSVPDLSAGPLTPDATVFDVDANDTPTATVTALKALGKTVICYFSAGTYEEWRADAPQFQASDLGKGLPEWAGERWIRTNSPSVRTIMTSRISMAAQKGCDAIDPDNIDGYQNDNGLNLLQSDAVNYVRFLSTTAAKYGMKIGLKNSLSIIPDVLSIVDFAVNEQCSALSECGAYAPFLAVGKPVFHIEYPNGLPNVSPTDRTALCSGGDGKEQMSTVMKYQMLDGWVGYCDGSIAVTNTTAGASDPHYTPKPTTSRVTATTISRTSTAKPTTTSKASTTGKPSLSTSTKTTTSKPATTSASGGGGSGCTAKHWDQCGGNDYKGCTVCAAGFSCKAVSPPYYYQCL